MRFESFARIHAYDGANDQRQKEDDDGIAVRRPEHKRNGPKIEDHDPAADEEDEVARDHR